MSFKNSGAVSNMMTSIFGFSLKVIILEYKLYHNDKKISEDKIVKQTSYNSIDDKYELSQYENNILKNLSKIISDEMLFSIKLLENDN